MNDFDLSKLDTPVPLNSVSPYLTYGDTQVLKINSIELKMSQNTNAPKAILHMESKPINEPGFVAVDNAKGKVGRIGCGIYMNSDPLKREFLQKMKTIAAAMGIETEINKIKSESFEEVVQQISDLFRGRFATYTIVASEYQKPDGKIGITLMLPKFKFVEAEGADPSTIVKFDKNNPYHYKKIGVTPANVTGNKPTYGKYESATLGKPAGDKYSNWTDDHAPDNPNDPALSDLPF